MPTTDSAANSQVFSNDLDDFVSPGIGPEQSTFRCTSCQYVSFDYGGTMANDPVVAVRMSCEPLDGSNENKPFDIDWPVGPKMKEVAIVNNGGHLTAGPGSSKSGLALTSNWALALHALKDIGFDTKLLNGPTGVHYFEGGEYTVRRVPQPKREGLEDKNTKGFQRTYYTFLKIDALPGEARKGTARRTAAAPKATAAAAASASTTNAAAESNGSGSASLSSLIAEALAANGNTLIVGSDEMRKAVFNASKAANPNLSAKHHMDVAKSADAATVASLAESNGWVLDGETLVC